MGTDRIIVITDIDGTLVGDDAALERFAAWHAEVRPGVRLVYATGRHRASLERLVAETALPVPDATITAVGTEIHDPSGRPWPGWAERFDAYDAAVIRRALRAFDWLAPQPAEAQTRLKASYDVPDLADAQIEAIRSTLMTRGHHTRHAYSAGRSLDILPAAAGKGNAARFLVKEWKTAPDRVMVFGDTGNDLDLFGHGFLGTVVGNALPELTDAVYDHAYHSPFHYAAGVLDGIRHWSEA
jgi:sucrose-6F-phosphate phosphohydrolase